MANTVELPNWAGGVLALAPVLALCVTLIGTGVQYWIAKRQFRASVISTNRQAWINALRSDVAKLIATLEAYQTHARITPAALRDGEDWDKSIVEYTRSAHELLAVVRMYLNPEKDDQHNLSVLLQAVVQAMAIDHDRREQIIDVMQAIVTKEWRRVKRGE